MDDELARRTTVETSLAEFNAMRTEIADRSSTQTLLINLNLTALAAVVSIVATQDVDESLLLLLCPISCALGMLWADHGKTIRDLGTYINQELRPTLSDLADRPVLEWEAKSAAYRKGRNFFATYRFPLFLIFAGPPLTAISVTAIVDPGLDDFEPALGVYWGVSLALTAYVAGVIGKMQFTAEKHAPKDRRFGKRRGRSANPASASGPGGSGGQEGRAG